MSAIKTLHIDEIFNHPGREYNITGPTTDATVAVLRAPIGAGPDELCVEIIEKPSRLFDVPRTLDQQLVERNPEDIARVESYLANKGFKVKFA